MSDAIDQRLIKSVEAASLSYKQQDGDLFAVIPIGEQRSRIVMLESNTYTFTDVEMRCIKSVGYRGAYPDPKVLAYCLEQNTAALVGAWEASFNREEKKCTLVFCAKIGATLDGERLRKIVSTVAKAADRLEQKIATEYKF